MQYPQRFSDLPEYAFPRLRRLLDGVAPGGPELHMSIGEPRHELPGLVAEAVAAHAGSFCRYPPNDGAPELLQAAAGWIARRYGVAIDPEAGIMAVNGSREGLFNAALALSPERKAGRPPAVLMPNPHYPCYAAAALAAGAEPIAVPAGAGSGPLPDFAALPADTLDRVTLAYYCSPSNPQGAVAGPDDWRRLLALAERHDFRILADECYSEIYRNAPPMGALEAASAFGADPERVLAFNSLSKRSNAPGLRSGFVAGGRGAIDALKRLRAYAGAPSPLPLQHAAAGLWNDEAHVEASRGFYRQKYALADRVLGDLPGYAPPDAGFFLWIAVDDGEAAARALHAGAGVRVLPGAYLARPAPDGANPGQGFIRVALVADAPEVERGLTAIREILRERVTQERAD